MLEVRCKDGKHYPPNPLHQLCCGIMRYVREVKPTHDLFSDRQFADIRRTIDSEMKRLRSEGIGTTVKRVEPITEQEEDCLWEKQKLGEDPTSSTRHDGLYVWIVLCTQKRPGA